MSGLKFMRSFPFIGLLTALGFLLLVSHLAGPIFSSSVPAVSAADRVNPLDVATALSDAFSNVANQTLPAVVTITTERVRTMDSMGGPGSLFPEFFDRFMNPRNNQRQREYRDTILGSGVIVGSNGIILTANHVVQDAENVSVLLSDDREFSAEIVGTDPETDIAVLRLDADKDLPFVPLGSSGNLKVGDWVLALGNPFAAGLRGSVTAGIISAQGRSGMGLTRYEDFIQTDAAINPGNSGGPLVNIHGEVIGINTAIASRSGGYQGIGFAIPIDLVGSVMDNIVTNGRVIRGWLGVYIRDLDASLREAFGMDSDQSGGVLVDQVVDGSPADDAGIEDGDIILELEGDPIADGNDLRFRTASYSPGTKISVRLLREGKRKNLKVELGELDSQTASSEPDDSNRDALASIGFEAANLDDNYRAELRLDDSIEGVVVLSVERLSPAAKGELRAGDVIIKANKDDIDSLDALLSIIADTDSGEVILLKVIANSTRRFVAIRMP